MNTENNLKSKTANFFNNIPSYINSKIIDFNSSPFANDKGLNIKVLIFLLTLIIFLILSVYYILAPSNNTTSGNSNNNSNSSSFTGIILFLFFLFFLIGFLYLKYFKKEESNYYQQSKPVEASPIENFFSTIFNFKEIIGVILYTILIIYFFNLIFTDKNFTDNDFIKKYGYYIAPITIALTAFVFYQGFKSNYENQFNITYERIKMMILMFCFIAILLVYYSIAGTTNFIKDYYGFSLILTILIAIFAFIYLIILLIVPNENANAQKILETPTNLLNYFNKYTNALSISFIIFIIFSTIGITLKVINESNKEKIDQSEVIANNWYLILIVLITSILWSVLIFWSKSEKGFDDNLQNITNINSYYKIILGIFGVVISGCIIAWLVYNIQSLMGNGNKNKTTTRFILNLLLVLVILMIIYRTIIVELPYFGIKSNNFFTLFISVLLYIPCIFSDAYDYIIRNFLSGTNITNDYNSTTQGTFTLIIVMILLLIGLFILPRFEDNVILQGGNLLINEPVNTRNKKIVATYEDLNKGLNSGFDYNYSISFWSFLDAMPPSMNESYDKYTTLLSYGGKPDILYNPSLNTLLITMKLKNVDATKYDILDIKTTCYDDDETYLKPNESIVIVEKIENILLQKWNQFIINCEGGTIDVFFNGELIKSAIRMVPYMSVDNLVVGYDNGIYGGLCNLVYYSNPLSVNQIYYSYNLSKSYDPPIVNNSNNALFTKNQLNVINKGLK